MSSYLIVKKDELYHHGIQGQKWGIRRYQNPDGTLTEAGKQRYYGGIRPEDEKYFRLKNDKPRSYQRSLNRMDQAYADAYAEKVHYNRQAQKRMDKMLDRSKKIGWDISNDPDKSGDKKLQKYSDKFVDSLGRANAALQQMKAIEQRQWQTAADALSRGYDVQIKKIPRQTMTRGYNSAAFSLGVIGILAYGVALAAAGYPSVLPDGNKFKVRRAAVPGNPRMTGLPSPENK